MGDLGLAQNIQFKVPPFLGVTVGTVVVVGVVVVDVLVVDDVVDDAELQLRIVEAQINRIVTMMNNFFTVLPPFCFPDCPRMIY
jgi:hypothetical protein